MRRRRLATGAVVVLLAAVTVLAGCSKDEPKRVYVFGDSLVAQSSRYLQQDFSAKHGYRLRVEAVSGSATCDWFGNIAKAKREFRPEIVLMSFSGNQFSPCMKHVDGSPLTNEQYVSQYRDDTERAIGEFPGVPVYLVGAPVSASGDDRVWRVYREVAPEHPDVHFVDGGRYLTPHHRFALTMPCLPKEPCTGPVIDGVRNNVVRTPTDRAHFCPKDPGWGKPCNGYSSGAYRFALAMFEAVEHRSG